MSNTPVRFSDESRAIPRHQDPRPAELSNRTAIDGEVSRLRDIVRPVRAARASLVAHSKAGRPIELLGSNPDFETNVMTIGRF